MKQYHNVFVYGSLKRGYRLHTALAGSSFVSEVKTPPDYRLYSLGSFPALVATDKGKGNIVHGELFRITTDNLNYLDIVEGVKRGMYRRHNLKVIDKDGDEHEAVTYVWRLGVGNCRLIPGGIW